MLTLKKPVELHTAFPMTLATEGFGRRIIGNYQMLGAHSTPKELLFLMTAPQELPEELGSMTTLVNQQNITDNSSITMDVVNNVVNRILLDGSSSFTYQDQVYITSALSQIGITNPAEFMSEVRRLREENRSVLRMERLYEKELRQLLIRQSIGDPVAVLPLPAGGERAESHRQSDPRQVMALSVLERLESARIFDTVHAFQKSQLQSQTVLQSNSLRLTEQLRLSRELRLGETKQRIFQSPQITFLHHWNRYEHMDPQNPAQTEEQVLSQAAAAVLLTAVERAVVEREGTLYPEKQWLQTQNAFYQTAENTLARFVQYHSEYAQSPAARLPSAETVWNQYVQEIRQYGDLYQQIYPGQPLPQLLPLRRETLIHQESLRLERLREEIDRVWEEYLQINTQTLAQRSETTKTQSLSRERLETILGAGELPRREGESPILPPEMILPPPAETPEGEELPLSEENSRQEILQRLTQLHRQEELVRERLETFRSQEEYRSEERSSVRESHSTVRELLQRMDSPEHAASADVETAPTLPLIHSERSEVSEESAKSAEQTERDASLPMTRAQEAPSAQPPLRTSEEAEITSAAAQAKTRETIAQENSIYNTVQNFLNLEQRQFSAAPEARSETPLRFRSEEEASAPEAQRYLSPEQAERESPELLVEQLREIDRQNRLTLETIQREMRDSLPSQFVSQPAPDVKRTMEAALLAVENQEQAVMEMMRLPEQPRIEHRLSLEQAAILAQASPEERGLYEKIFAYQRAPEAALAMGLFRPATMGALQAELSSANRSEEPLELEHPGEEAYRQTERLREQSELVLERFQRNAPTLYQELQGQRPAVQIVHKTAQPDMTEELLEQLRQNRTQSVITDENTQNITQMHTTDVHQTQQNMVTQTTEDITELVNRTLSRQMRTISDQVYRQMERRLQTERSRRGRM